MKELISVIVPVYNSSQYLSYCLNSICNQTYRDIEIILVDDGSSDCSVSILEKYAKEDARIKVYKIRHQGVSEARNIGLAKSTGQYVCFVDSDDIIVINAIEVLYNALLKYNCDILQSAYRRISTLNNEIVTASKIVNTEEMNKVDVYSRDEGAWALQNGVSGINGMVWLKLYKKNCFKGIRFPLGKIHEDEMVMHRILYNANKIGFTHSCLYFYHMSEDSIMRAEFQLNKFDAIDAMVDRYQFYESVGLQDCAWVTAQRLGVILIDLYRKTQQYFPDAKKQMFFLREHYHNSLNLYIDSPYLTEELRQKHRSWIEHPEEGEWYWILNYMRSFGGKKLSSADDLQKFLSETKLNQTDMH